MGYWDDFTRSQFVIPAADLAAIDGLPITAIKFYTTSSNVPYTSVSTCDVYLMEVNYTSISAFEPTASATTVYSGTVSIVSAGGGGEMTITFATPYVYGGGNLLIGIENTTDAEYTFIYFYGQNVTGASGSSSNSSSLSNVTFSQRNFIPKTTFTYTPPAGFCYAPTGLNSSNVDGHSADLAWTAGDEETAWAIEYSTSSDFSSGVTQTTASGTPAKHLTGLDPETQYYARVKAVCGVGDESSWSNTYSFTTPCAAVTTLPWTEDFESFTASTVPDCWDNSMSGSSTLSSNPERIWGVYEYSSNKMLRMYNYYVQSGSALINTPPITLPASGDYQLTFGYSHRANCGDFTVKVSTDGGASFTDLQSFANNGSNDYTNPGEFTEATISLATYVGQTIVLQFFSTANYSSGAIFIDNIRVGEAPSCLKPTLVTCTATTPNSATLGWTAGDPNDDAWQISYKTGAGEWSTPADITTNPYTLSELTENTTYDVRVRTNCGAGEERKSEWTTVAAAFTTPCLAITVDNTHPYTVDMMSDDIADCWTETDGTYHWDFDDSYGANFSSSGSSLQTSTKLVSPLFDFGAGDNWMSFTGYLEGYEGWYDDYTATLKVYYRTSPSGAWQELTGQSYSATGDDDLDLDVSEVLLPENTCQLAFEATSNYDYANAYLYDLTVEKVPSCRKPAALALVSKTAHSASLSFNETGTADAWVLEYSVNSDFSSASELTTGFTESAGTVTVDLSTLAQSTTYYVRVKSNCGGGDYSAWCNSINFTTLAGNAVPTGLAVNPATITSSSATASWTAVAGNTLHESYDIYWATADVMEVPASPVAPNLISGITATSQVISGLDPENNYKVWVRDYCGTDGYSEWSSPVAFTTASACQTPDGLDKENVTSTSATITWNTYGQTEFNLRYSDDEGAHWTDVNDVTQPYTLDGVLTANTAYQVKVQATCANAETWSATLNFSTPCDPITVDADNPFTENFDATDFPSSCWDTIKSGTRAWTRNTYKNHNEGGSASAYSGYYGDIYLIMPTLALANDDEAVIRLTFWSYNTYTGSYDKNSVVLLDGNTETELWSPASVSQSWEKTTIDLSAYKGQNITLAFKYEGYNAHGWYVDDLKVEYHYTKSISANSWYAISAPVHNSGNNETLAGVTNLTDDDYDLLRYNETNATWENQKTHNDFILERGKGYIYRTNAAKTLTFNGTRNSGDIDVSLTATNAAGTMKGWNLLGNPYPHTYALARDCYSLSTNGTWTVHDAGSYTMAVAEAVLVKSDNTETFHFTETPSTKSAPASTIAFTVSNDEFTDIAYARFSSEEGLPKISHLNPEAPMLSIDGYAIATLNEGTESFPMSFSGQGSYTLTISGNTDVTGYLHLVDRLTGRDIDLLSTPSYSFTGSPVSDRFTVKLTPDANEGNSTSRFAIFDGNSLVINGEGTLEVYDVMGRRLMSAEVTGSEYRIPGSDLHTGVYVLRMNGNSQKIVIK